MKVTLQKAVESDCIKIHTMQIRAFASLLKKYQDYDSNPATEPNERILQSFSQPFTDYYFICLNGDEIGAIRICNFGELCRVSPIFILPEYQGFGYAQKAMLLAEQQYPDSKRWELDTILQEEKLCHLYEKLGYQKTGKYRNVKAGMDLVFYEKII